MTQPTQERGRSGSHPRIGLMLGDVTGIGPEIAARFLATSEWRAYADIIVIGDRRVLELGMKDAGVALPLRPFDDRTTPDAIALIDLQNIDPSTIPRGAVSAESGRLTGETLARAITLAGERVIDAICFAPLNKGALHAGGWRFRDEHEMFAHLLGHQGHFSEMNVLDDLWMSRVTSHVSLREALDRITTARVLDTIRLAHRTLRGAGFETPRLAVAALNPHGGEGGLFGREEIDVIAPAVRAAVAAGISCRGPFPADTIYLKAFAGEYDGVVAMYHDQGQIATKLRGFNRGVTVTAGLEAIFTTPAHGTAFDIVGKGVASAGAMESAVRLAAKLADSKARLR